MTARIAGPWKQTGNINSPQLLADHPLPLGASSVDVTRQPVANLIPSPNLFTIQVSGVTSAWLLAVAADNNYLILWSE